MSYFEPPFRLNLAQLEKIVYSDDRLSTLSQMFSTNSKQYKFYATLFSQLELESSFDQQLPEKIKSSQTYLKAYEDYCRNVIKQPHDPQLKLVKFKHAIYQFQSSLSSLGANDDDIRRLELFHDGFTTNYEILTQSLTETETDRVQMITDLCRAAGYYYNHAKPGGYNGQSSFNHWSDQITGANLTTTVDSIYSNPIESIYDTLKRWNSVQSYDYQSLNELSFPYIFMLHEYKVINLQSMQYFPVVGHILSTITNSTAYPKLVEIIAWFLEQSDKLLEADKNDQYYNYRSYAHQFSPDAYTVYRLLSYQQLIQLQQLYPTIGSSITFIQALIDRYLPSSFSSLRINQTTGVENPFTTTPADSAILASQSSSSSSRVALIEKPLCIYTAEDLKKSTHLIPSFLLTAMSTYDHCLSIVLTNIKTLSASKQKGLKAYYYSLLASYLYYTTQFNVYRFDLFDTLFINSDIFHRYHLHYDKYQSHLHRNHGFPTSMQPLNTTVFPYVPFETVIDTYIEQYFTIPEHKNFRTCKYKDNVSVGYLAQVFYQVKITRSGTVIDVTCDQTPTPVVSVDNPDDITEQLQLITPPDAITATTTAADTTGTTPSSSPTQAPTHVKINTYNVYNATNIHNTVDEYLTQQHEPVNHEFLHAATRVYRKSITPVSTPMIKWASRYQPYHTNYDNYTTQHDGYPLLNRYCVNTSTGDITTSLIVRNIQQFTVNVYEIDTFNYYQSQLKQPSNGNHPFNNGNDDSEFDPNIDLEGMIPNYTTRVVLPNATNTSSSSLISPYTESIVHLNLANLPTRGIFLIEVIHGQDAIRSCCRKGKYTSIQRQIANGTLVLVLDENGRPVHDARVYLGTDMFTPLGDSINSNSSATDTTTTTTTAAAATLPDMNDHDQHVVSTLSNEYQVEPSMFILVPAYTSRKTVVLTEKSQQYASVDVIEPIQEHYDMSCEWHVSSESLTTNSDLATVTTTGGGSGQLSSNALIIDINGNEFPLKNGPTELIGGGLVGAEVVLRPTFMMNNKPLSLHGMDILKSTLYINASLQNNIEITDIVDNFPLSRPNTLFQKNTVSTTAMNNDDDNGEQEDIPMLECLHAFAIPTNLQSLRFRLEVTIMNQEGKEYDLSSSYSIDTSGIHHSLLSTGMIFLRRVNGIYFLYTIDKTGLSLPFIPLKLTLSRAYDNRQGYIYISTDINGCAELGALVDCELLTVEINPSGDYNTNRQDLSTTSKSIDYQSSSFIATQLIRGTFTYPLTSSKESFWPDMLQLLVDDATDTTTTTTTATTQQQQQQQSTSQVILPFPFDVDYNILFYKLCIASIKDPKLSLTLKHTTSQPLPPLTATGNTSNDDDYNTLCQYLINSGRIALYEVTNINKSNRSSTPRQLCTKQCITIHNQQLVINQLKANRRYQLTVMGLNGQIYQTSINTYRHPGHKTITAASYGAQLPILLQSDTTMGFLADYLITNTGILPIDQSNHQSLAITHASIQPMTTSSNGQELTIQLTNWTDTTQIAILFSTLLTTTIPFIHSIKQSVMELTSLQQTRVANIQSHMPKYSPLSVSFVSSASISGEREYILHRRALLREISQVGIMLPMPSLLLNKRLRQHTDPIEDKEKKRAQKGTVERELAPPPPPPCAPMPMRATMQPMAASVSLNRSARKKSAKEYSFGGGGYYDESELSSSVQLPSVHHCDSYYTMDILREKSSVLYNLVPDSQTGILRIQRPAGMDMYTTATIIAYDRGLSGSSSGSNKNSVRPYGFDSIVLDIPQPSANIRLPYQDSLTIAASTAPATTTTNGDVQTVTTSSGKTIPVLPTLQQPFIRDNSFKSTLDHSKQYAEQHQIDLINPTTTATTQQQQQQQPATIIGPHKSVELEVLISMNDIYALLTSLSTAYKSRGTPILRNRSNRPGITSSDYETASNRYEVLTALHKYKFLVDWPQFNDQQKLTHLDRYACHELHLFIYFHDEIFYERYLRLHLSNKLEKDVVDLWLLAQPPTNIPHPSSAAATPVTNELYQLFTSIQQDSIDTLIHMSRDMLKYNVFEKILILSVADKSALRTAALYMRDNNDDNASLQRNHSEWVVIFESCLRRRMLVLNTQNTEDMEPDDEDGDNKEEQQPEQEDDAEETESSDFVEDDSDDGSDGWNSDEAEIDDNDDAEGYGAFDSMADVADERMDMVKHRAVPRGGGMMMKTASLQLSRRSEMSAPPRAAMLESAAPPPPSQSMARFSAAPPAPMAMAMSMSSAAMPSKRLVGNAMSIDSMAAKVADQKPKAIASYKPLEKTGEYEERTWYCDPSRDGKNYIIPSKSLFVWCNFWVDFALYLSQDDAITTTTPATGLITRQIIPFTSSSLLDLYGASVNEILVAFSVLQLSSQPIGRSSVMGFTRGKDITAHPDAHHMVNPNMSIQSELAYRTVKPAKNTPVIVLHRQLQVLNTPTNATTTTITTTTGSDTAATPFATNTNTSLTVTQYYIDLFASLDKKQYVYVQPNNLLNRRVYLCRVVVSNMSSTTQGGKILIQLPHNSVSVAFDPQLIDRNQASSGSFTHLSYLDSSSLELNVSAYSSRILSYAFLVGNQQQYNHYGPTISTSSSSSNTNDQKKSASKKSLSGAPIMTAELLCYAPSLTLHCSQYQPKINKRDPLSIARDASDEELCQYLANHFKQSDYNTAATDDDDDEEVDTSFGGTTVFNLHNILYRFHNNDHNDVENYMKRLELYTRIMTIIKGYVTTHQDSPMVLATLSYSLLFIKEYHQYYSKNSKVTFTAEQLTTLSYALAVVLKRYGYTSILTMQNYNHLEYLPLVAARIHNSSLAAHGGDTGSGNDQQHQEISIPDKQLKEQYTRAMQFALTRASSLSNVPFTHLLSLIYYALLLHQMPRVKMLFTHLLNALQRLYDQKQQSPAGDKTGSGNGRMNATTRVQFAYLLCYVDVLLYGQLLTTLSSSHVALIEKIFNITLTSSTPSVATTGGLYIISATLSKSYIKYPIRQWKTLFTQTYQYLIEGRVIVTGNNNNNNTSSTTTTTPTTVTTSADGDDTNNDSGYDVNVAGGSALQRNLRQDEKSNATPSLSCRVQYNQTSSVIDIYYSNLEDQEIVLDIHFIDSELLLSHRPFMSNNNNNSSSSSSSDNKDGDNSTGNQQVTRPHLSIILPITPNTTTMTHKQCVIPAKFSTNAQLTIRAPSSHVQYVSPLLHNNFITQVLSKQGVVRIVDHNGLPISGVYVKAYAQVGGSSSTNSRFHHDGYTDIRGKFDYASTSQKKVDNDSGKKFALIIVHPVYGTTVVYTDKPQE